MSDDTMRSRRKSRALAASAVAISKQTSDINALKVAVDGHKAAADAAQARCKVLEEQVAALEKECQTLRQRLAKYEKRA
ncbi:MAG: hypothetical protein HUU29_05585 [Planctomycetaceae bacterium]|nr:hypothetical protein [Planctomycetaceae bacterium]